MSGLWPNGTYSIPRVTSEFGPRRSPGGIGSTNHLGIDVASIGAVRSAEAGMVIFSTYNGGSGLEVRIKGDSGREFRYKHNRRLHVRAGNRVAAGQHIADEGMTGAATGPHVHLEVLVGGKQVNPRTQLGAPAAAPAGGGKLIGYDEATFQRQSYLNAVFGAGLAADGKLGPRTRAAYRTYQGVIGVSRDGLWGAQTEAAHVKYYNNRFRPAPAAPAGGATLRNVQQALKTKFPAYAGRISVDGIDGPQTRAAVREFQRRSGLKVDGVAGPATKRALGL